MNSKLAKPLRRKFMTVDPGWNTGIACWSSLHPAPMSNALERLPSALDRKEVPIETKLSWMSMQFLSQLKAYQPNECYMEGTTFWGSNVASFTSFARGNAIGLTYLVGTYFQCCITLGIKPIIIPPQKWKGQMPDDTVEKRIDMRLGKNWVRDKLEDVHGKTRKVHVAMAVGIGLDVKGIL